MGLWTCAVKNVYLDMQQQSIIEGQTMKHKIKCNECEDEIPTGSINQRIRLKIKNASYNDFCSKKCLRIYLDGHFDERDYQGEDLL